MNTTTDRDDEETIFQSSHREWAEDQERRQQERDEQAVQQFLRMRLEAEGSLTELAECLQEQLRSH